MELVPSDLLKHSVELTLRKVFRIIRSVKYETLLDLDVQGSELCAKMFTAAFAKLSHDLSDHWIMAKQNMYYRVMVARTSDHEVVHRSRSRHEAPALPRVAKTPPKPTVKVVEPKSEERAGGATKVCSGHLGKQLSAVRKDGRPYSCSYGKDPTAPFLTCPSWESQIRGFWTWQRACRRS
jgi:hypothetical protein